MRNFLIRVGINAAALVIVAFILPGIDVGGNVLQVIVVALLFGLINSVVLPVVQLLGSPLIVLSAGLVTVLIDGLMLQITAWLSDGLLHIDNFLWALFGGLVMGVVSSGLEWVLMRYSERRRRFNVRTASDLRAKAQQAKDNNLR